MSQPIDGSQIEGLIQKVSGESMLGARADFKPTLFDSAIEQKGYRLLWEQGMFCSCLSVDSGQSDYGCPACKGKGYVYFEPTEIRAIVTSLNGHKQQDRPGLDEMGTAYLTPSSERNVGFRDRFTFLDFTTKFSEILTRGDTSLDRLRYPAKTIISLRNRDAVYKHGIDFKLTRDGKDIEWITQPMYPDHRYSILYTTNPVYIAIGPIHEIRGTYTKAKAGGLEAFVQLPKQFQIKREDFLENE